MEESPANTTSGNTTPNQASSSLFAKIKQLSHKQKIVIGVVLVVLVALMGMYFYKSRVEPFKDGPIVASVGDTPLPEKYLEYELKYYPTVPDAQVKKMLTDKIVNDEVVLKSAQKEGLISAYPMGQAISDQEYLQRAKSVQTVKQLIGQRSDGVTVEVVSIWFYNATPGTAGYEEGKKIASTKINDLHRRVKNKSITIETAGKMIASDSALAKIDRAYKENAYVSVKAKNGEKITFWPDFDQQLRGLQPGELTEIYTGIETDNVGTKVPSLYAFGQVSEKQENGTISSFDSWLEQQKKQYEIKYY